MKRLLSCVLGPLLGLLGGVAVVAATPLGAAAAGPDCSETAIWGSAYVDAGLDFFGGSITDIRTGRQDCYDRLVVDVGGAAGGFVVAYVDEVPIGPTDNVMSLRGGAKLWVFVHSPIYDGDYDNLTYDPPDWGEAVDVTGFETFRQVALGATFEGDTDIGLGVRERLPFRAFTLDGPGTGSRLVIDVAHSWQGQGTPSASPLGNYESASGAHGGVEVKGWTIDPDRTGPIYVWVTVDGAGRHLYANVNRPDVGAVYPAYGPGHGFRAVVPATAGRHTVCVTASNVGPGDHTPLGCRTVTVPSASPFGNHESATGVVGGVEIKGWMADPSDPTRALYGWVTIDGTGRHVLANKNRPDIAAALPGYGPNHGFRDTLPAGPGTHTVCVTAANVGPGDHTPLGCRTVQLTTVDVHFVNDDRFAVGTEPYTDAVPRTVPAAAPAAGALRALFAGPTPAEQAQSLSAVLSEATGFADLTISDGIARVRLTGGCNSQGSTLTIYDMIAPTLKQFPAVEYVKVYDPSGHTEQPDGQSDSIPACLEP